MARWPFVRARAENAITVRERCAIARQWAMAPEQDRLKVADLELDLVRCTVVRDNSPGLAACVFFPPA